jgi:hydroxymethylglutaryl-CoA lyase
MLKLIECPRDAMQGIKSFIPTEVKVQYIDQLLQVGFDTLDVGSFVSPKAIPQMADTDQVIQNIQWQKSHTQLLVIVANTRGALQACQYQQINFLGFPFSISETFQLRNTNSTIEESLKRVEEIQSLCLKFSKQLVVYLSMGFGNPYGDLWNAEIVLSWTSRLNSMGIKIISLSDTIGVSNPHNIQYLFSQLIPAYPQIEFGAHLHTQPHNWKEKILSAYQNGCRRFDGAIKGYGGCPMAKDDLTGNMPTESILSYAEENQIPHKINHTAFKKAMNMALTVFPH